MKVLEGGRLKSKLTGRIYEVKMITDRSVVLESKDGSCQEWTEWGNLPFFFEEAEIKRSEGLPTSYSQETPFDSIESARKYMELLIQAIEESRRDVDVGIALAESARSESRKRAFQLVANNLGKLSQHMTASRRILNDLRTLSRLLLEELELDKHATQVGGSFARNFSRQCP